MNKRDREKLNQCSHSKCPDFELRCIAPLGNECKRLGGNQIPRMRLVHPKDEVDKLRHRSDQVSTFKPYFMDPGGSDHEYVL